MTAQPWLKMWVEARTDRKLDTLTDAQHRTWFNLLLFAAEQEDRGTFTDDRTLALEVAKGKRAKVDATIPVLVDLDILVDNGDGSYTFRSFEERQQRKPSDTPEMARERKRRQREREAADAMSRPVTPMSRPVTRDTVTCHAEVEVEVEVEKKDLDQNPVSSRVSDFPRTERGSYPQAEDPKHAIAYFEEKAERDLTADERSSVKRWVRDYGSLATTMAIGGVLGDGAGPNLKIIGGRLKKQQMERTHA